MNFTPDELEVIFLTSTNKELLQFLMDRKFIKNEFFCPKCHHAAKNVKYLRSIDECAWRCMQSACPSYKKYYSIRAGSFFEPFSLKMSSILRILLKYACRQPMHSIKISLDVSASTIEKVINRLIEKIPETDFSNNKFGGPDSVVQIDETMLNYKCKSHRGRSSTNRTDSICIVEVKSSITRCFAKVIPDKKSRTLVPIICSQVANNSIIWTDEHKSYAKLEDFEFYHGTVCHKYEFMCSATGINTQAVESFNNELKLEIKRRKGIKTEKREKFLKEFCFLFNNKRNLLQKILELIKI